MATSLVLQERINTTLPKAKELRRIVERMVTLGKRGDLHARRQTSDYLFDDEATKKLFSELAQRFKDRQGGYTRILRRTPRHGDGAAIATIEFVDYVLKGVEDAAPKKESKKAEKESAAKKEK